MTDAYNKYAKHAQSSSFFQAISSLSKPSFSSVPVKRSMALNLPHIFCHQGIDSLVRCENTGYGLENRSTGAGTRYALVNIDI